MNHHVNAIAGRMSLRQPQRRSLEILDRIVEIAPPSKEADIRESLEAIRGEFPSVTDFERDFPSVCFALATGVGKTRLMGAFISYLARQKDLVLIMDESHRYRASAGVRAINELKPILGLELTATPFVETGKGPVPFKNVIYDYPLGKAMADGFVKEPAVVTRKDFNPAGMSPEEIERLKLEDGIRLHESVKVELETYARETGQFITKPFLLVIARETTHAGKLLQLIQSDGFFDGRYKDKVIQVDSSRTGAEEDEMIERLLKVEHTDEPTKIVIHVNMLKEGWDVTNLYTIVPLRAANARILIEQSIGRDLRLPYGRRTGSRKLSTKPTGPTRRSAFKPW
jgi:type III restriction enzyme